MKDNTNRSAKKLSPGEARFIATTHGLAAKIAAIGGMSRGHVSKVVRRLKPATERFHEAMLDAIFEDSAKRNRSALSTRYGRR
jgi:hypothetical protein